VDGQRVVALVALGGRHRLAHRGDGPAGGDEVEDRVGAQGGAAGLGIGPIDLRADRVGQVAGQPAGNLVLNV
jgi:hypothetical protein